MFEAKIKYNIAKNMVKIKKTIYSIHKNHLHNIKMSQKPLKQPKKC